MTQKPNHKKPNRIKPYKGRIVRVPEDEYYKAENRWFNFWKPQKPEIDDFHKFLKLPRNYWGDVGHLVMSPAAARKIALLNSPHYHALLMAYKIKEHSTEIK